MPESGLEERVARLEGRVEGFESRFDRLDRRIDGLDAKVEAVRREILDTVGTHFRWVVGLQVTVLVTLVGALLFR